MKSFVKKSQIKLSMSSNNTLNKLFDDIDGYPVFEGDWVNIIYENTPFPKCGIITNHNGLRIECFNMLLYKWRYYYIDDDKE